MEMGMPEARPDEGPENEATPFYAVVVPGRGLATAALFAVVVLAGVALLDRAHAAVGLVAAAVTVAVLVQPFLRALCRVVPRAVAYVITTLGMIVGLTALLGVVTWDLDRQAGELSNSLVDAVNRLPSDSSAAEFAADIDLQGRIQRGFDGIAPRLVLGSDDPIAVAGEVAKIVVIAVLAAFILANGADLVAGAIRLIRRASLRATAHEAVDNAVRSGGAFVRRTIAISVLHGVVAGFFAWVFDVPGVVSVGAWIAVTSAVPIVGGIVGWFPVVALAWVREGPPWLVITIAIAAILADRLLRRRFCSSVLHLGPLLTFLGLAAGHAFMGIGGAVVGLTTMAMAAAALATDTRERLDAVVDVVTDESPVEDDPAPVVVSGVERTERERGRHVGVVRLVPSVRTSAVVAAGILLAYSLFRLQQGLGGRIIWFIVGAFIAFGVDRPVSAIERRAKLPRVVAVAMVFLVASAAVGGVIAIGGRSVTDATSSVVEDAPDTVQSLESLPLLGPWLKDQNASDRVQQWIEDLPDHVAESRVLDRVANAAGDGLLGVTLLLGVLLATLLDGPRLVRAVHDRVPVRRRRSADRLGHAAYLAISNVAAAAAFVATLNGTVVMLLALALGIPLAPLLGLWAAAWNVIPQVGGFVGALPLVALGLGQDPWRGIVALIVFVSYQTFENHVIQPLVGSRAVHLPPLVLMVGALFGGAFAGFVGAVLAGPILGVGKVAFDAWRGPAPARIEDREPARGTPGRAA
jgi:predicted PurR-regulated permease PerM